MRLYIVILLICLFAPLCSYGQHNSSSPKHLHTYRDSGYSTVLIERDTADGYERVDETTTIVSYHVLDYWTEHQDKRLLIKEKNTTLLSSNYEGERGSIELTALLSEDNFQKPIWTKKTDAGVVDYNNLDEYVRVTNYGCCGADNGYMIYRSIDGKKIMNLSTELSKVRIPNKRSKRYVGILSRESVAPQPDFDSDKAFLGLLTYIDPFTLKKQQVVLEQKNAKDSIVEAQFWFDSIGFTPDSVKDRENYQVKNELNLWTAESKNDPNAYDGFTIDITIGWQEPTRTIRIPVKNDKLMIGDVHSDFITLRFR